MLRSVSKALILVWLMAAVSSEAFLLAGTLHSQHGKRCGIVMSSIDDAALPARSQVRGLAVAGRREFLLRQQVVAGCVLGLCSPAQVHAASPPPGESGAEDVSQNIRKAAAKIPGMGPPDVAYPEGMLGRWQVQRVLADVDFPQGRENAQESLAEELLARKGRIDAFSARFIPGKNGIVSDREFNVRNLIKATEGTSVDVQWKVLNPNVLTVSYPNGALRETKVTKRATNLDPKAKAVEWSEYSRIADLSTGGALEGRGSIPEISARWARSRFKIVDDASAEALILEYFLPPGSQDPAAATMKAKYRLLYRREPPASQTGAEEGDGEEEQEDGRDG